MVLGRLVDRLKPGHEQNDLVGMTDYDKVLGAEHVRHDQVSAGLRLRPRA